MSFILREYQEEALGALRESDSTRKLMVLPTGAGKTVVFAHHIKDIGAERVLIIAHRKEIIEQGVNTLRSIYPERRVGMLMADRKDYHADILVSSIQTLARRKTLAKVRKDFDLVIIDEAHHSTANTYKRVLYRFGLLDAVDAGYKNVEGVKPVFQQNRTLLGVTATPRRTDKVSLDEVFDEITFSIGIPSLIPDYLSDFRAVSVSSGVNLSDVKEKVRGGELREGEVGDAFMHSSFMDRLSRIIDEYASDRKHILVFMPDVQTTHKSVTKLSKSGYSAAAITGNTPKPEREAYLKAFREGRIRVIVNCMVLTEGVDIPNIDCIVMARPTKSATLMIQMLGRGFRKVVGKRNCLLIDIAHERRQQDLLSVAGSGIFGDLSDVHLEHPELSLMELAKLQRDRLPHLLSLRGILEQRIAMLTEEQEQETEIKEEEDEVEEAGMLIPEREQEVIPENIQLLMDTEFLRRICQQTAIGNFWNSLVRELQKPRYGWFTQASTDKQRKFLVSKGIDAESVDMLNKGEASAIIGVLQKISPPTTAQLNFLKQLGVDGDGMPKSKTEASQLIDKLKSSQMDEFEMNARPAIPTAAKPRRTFRLSR